MEDSEAQAQYFLCSSRIASVKGFSKRVLKIALKSARCVANNIMG